MIFPWQQDLYEQLIIQDNKLHHALLLYGKAGIGKLDFAQHLAQYLLCSAPIAMQACGGCDSCHWVTEGVHPDFKIVMPLEKADDVKSGKKATKSQQIIVEQIRELHTTLALTQHQSGERRVVLIHPAEAMNTVASNALLKLLEEPPEQTVFLLVSHQKHQLLPTILSRCSKAIMPIPNKMQGLAWLNSQNTPHAEWYWQYSGGAPVEILQWTELEGDFYAWYQQWRVNLAKGANLDIGSAVTTLLVQGMEQAITLLQKWLLDLWLSIHKQPVRYHIEDIPQLERLAKLVDLRQLLYLQQELNRFKITATHPLNKELQLEQLLLRYRRVFQAQC